VLFEQSVIIVLPFLCVYRKPRVFPCNAFISENLLRRVRLRVLFTIVYSSSGRF